MKEDPLWGTGQFIHAHLHSRTARKSPFRTFTFRYATENP